nr:exosporium leader peptide-containing protein [Bacillus cereus]
MFDKNEIQKINGILQANALNPNLIGPTLPPIPPFTFYPQVQQEGQAQRE